MRRRRKQRLQWFPTIGTELDQNTSFGQSPAGRAFSVSGIGPGAPSKTIFTPLTFDQPTIFEAEAEGGVNPNLINAMSLADWQMQAWRLKRIVGKIFIGATLDDTAANGVFGLLVTAGFIVRNVDSETGDPRSSTIDQAVDSLQNIQDPWIWRRQWILSTRLAQQISGDSDAVANFPRTTAGYGSVLDGPHIDAKTNRVIGPEERLFFNVTVTVQPTPSVAGFQDVGHVYGYLDYRLLGGIQRATNRRNASR
jgi:hypothetical protein